MISPLTALGVSAPILAAPMAGGPSTPALVTAAARANGLGFLAGGYKPADALAEQIAAVRAEGVGFGVNLFGWRLQTPRTSTSARTAWSASTVAAPTTA